MNAPTGLDFAGIPERIQSEVQRAIMRSIKGVEYLSTSGPSLGSTPKGVLSDAEARTQNVGGEVLAEVF